MMMRLTRAFTLLIDASEINSSAQSNKTRHKLNQLNSVSRQWCRVSACKFNRVEHLHEQNVPTFLSGLFYYHVPQFPSCSMIIPHTLHRSWNNDILTENTAYIIPHLQISSLIHKCHLRYCSVADRFEKHLQWRAYSRVRSQYASLAHFFRCVRAASHPVLTLSVIEWGMSDTQPRAGVCTHTRLVRPLPVSSPSAVYIHLL